MEAYLFNPSARTASTLTEFVEVCQTEPNLAAHHFGEGYFEAWLRAAGRRDLAEAATRIRMSGVSALEGLQQFVQAALEPTPRSRARQASAGRPATRPGSSKSK